MPVEHITKGRPLKFKTPEELQKRIDKYFQDCWEEAWAPIKDRNGNITQWEQQRDRDGNPLLRLRERPTITGLALALDTTRYTLLEYTERTDEYAAVILKAKTMIEHSYELGAAQGDIHPAVGIFALKNFGWTDVVQINSNRQPEQLTQEEIRRQLQERNAG